jgi:hypothetical protein
MNSKEFKIIFGEVAKTNGFEKSFGGWFKEGAECIIVLDLQKSNFGDSYELNIKIYVQGAFGSRYVRNKDLVKKDTGDIFRRQPPEYKDIFDFDEPMDDESRKGKLEKLFSGFIVPFTDKALSKSGIKELADKGEVTLLPAVLKELGI